MVGEQRGEESEIDKEAKIRELFGGNPDAIAVLSAGIIPRAKQPGYKTTEYAHLDPHGLLGGGKARVIAGAEAAFIFPEAKIIANSYEPGKEQRN
ncbi:MAG: hypothetical protein HY397_01775 [Candidatus Doudnabacteria bacterium]|nr:hypothetical protein [Candidatus Doudnabacteria bacterium]